MIDGSYALQIRFSCSGVAARFETLCLRLGLKPAGRRRSQDMPL